MTSPRYDAVANALEALAVVAERDHHDRAWSHPARERLRQARCCDGHLAGRLGVALFDALQRDQRLLPAAQGYALTPAGRLWLASSFGSSFGLEPGVPSARRRYAYACLDWSERRDHLAGQLADELYAHVVQRGWVRRAKGRAVDVTPRGRRELLPLLDADVATAATR